MTTPLSLTEAQVQFGAEFVTLVVTASALALLLVRPPRRSMGPSTWLPLTALLVLAAASFAHGSLLVTGRPVEWLGVGRLAAAGVLLLAFPYRIGRNLAHRRLAGLVLRLGVIAWAGSGLTEALKGPTYLADGLLAAGSVLTAATLLAVAQRSIAVKVGAGGATSLFVVVLVLALALSTVISSSVQHEGLNRLSARAQIEKDVLSNPAAVSSSARLMEADLAGYFNQPNANPLVEFAFGTPAQKAAAAGLIRRRLEDLANLGHIGNLVYVSPDGTSSLSAGSVPVGVATDPHLLPSVCPVGKQGLFVYGSVAVLAASSPLCTTGNTLLGSAIVVMPLDAGFLAGRHQIDPTESLALVSGGTVLARAGQSPDPLATVARLRDSSGQSLAQVVGSQFVSVATLSPQGGGKDLALVLSTSANTVLSTRDQLFRTLFLIAFGGTVLALGLAVFTGDRITAGLRRLTATSMRIQAGDTTVRSGVTGDDEVAALGSAFDEMMDSLAAQSAALRAAVEDEARLRNRLEAVVAGMTDALIAVDGFGRITDFNQAAEVLTGVPADTALGSRADEVVKLVEDDGRPVAPELFSRAGAPSTVTGRVGDVPVAVSTGALQGPSGEVAGTVLVFRDLRAEREIERMKTEFLSRVGHELRTPLTGILGYADILLRRDPPADKARAWHEEILQSARHLLRIVEMLEFFASSGAGRMVLHQEPVDVAALVNGIASAWAPRLPPNLSIGRRIAREPALVAADRRWLRLAIDELIDNAVKFSPEGGRIVVKVAHAQRHAGSEPERLAGSVPERLDSDRVEISVSDQGVGMSAEQYDRVFGEFVQGDSSDTRRFGGLGLGLAVVRRVVEAIGGTVGGRSAPGRGTLFVISLPAWVEAGPPGPDQADGSVGEGRRSSRSRARRFPTRPGAGS